MDDPNLGAGDEGRLPHAVVDQFIYAQLPQELKGHPENISHFEVVEGSVRAPLIPIKNLFLATGQLAHIGLGQSYTKPVIYIDADYADHQQIREHELFEIARWEEKRQQLKKSWPEMRAWIRTNLSQAVKIADQYHQSAPDVSGILQEAAKRVEGQIRSLTDRLGDDRVNKKVRLGAAKALTDPLILILADGKPRRGVVMDRIATAAKRAMEDTDPEIRRAGSELIQAMHQAGIRIFSRDAPEPDAPFPYKTFTIDELADSPAPRLKDINLAAGKVVATPLEADYSDSNYNHEAKASKQEEEIHRHNVEMTQNMVLTNTGISTGDGYWRTIVHGYVDAKGRILSFEETDEMRRLVSKGEAFPFGFGIVARSLSIAKTSEIKKLIELPLEKLPAAAKSMLQRLLPKDRQESEVLSGGTIKEIFLLPDESVIEATIRGGSLVIASLDTNQQYSLMPRPGKIYVLGRRISNMPMQQQDVPIIAGDSVSRRQLEFKFENNSWFVRDVSRSGTRREMGEPLSKDWVEILRQYADSPEPDSLIRERDELVRKAQSYHVDLRIARKITEETLEAARIALETIREMGELLQKSRDPIIFEIAKIQEKENLGRAFIDKTLGPAQIGLTQHSDPFGSDLGLNRIQLKQTVAHELLHKLSTAPDRTGHELVMPVSDWIALLRMHGMTTIFLPQDPVALEDYLNIGIHGFETVKTRIRDLRGEYFPFGAISKYQRDPHEIVAWHGTGAPNGFGAYGEEQETLDLLQRNLLRARRRVFEFDPVRGRWFIQTPRAMNAAEMALAGVVSALVFLNVKRARRQFRSAWKLWRTRPLSFGQILQNEALGKVELDMSRSFKRLAPSQKLIFKVIGDGGGETIALADGTGYQIGINGNITDGELLEEIKDHELAHVMREGQSQKLSDFWEARLGRRLGGWVAWGIDEFLTISLVNQLYADDSTRPSLRDLAADRRALEAASPVTASEADELDPTAQELTEAAGNARILAQLRAERRSILGAA